MKNCKPFDSGVAQPGTVLFFKHDEHQRYPMRFKFMAFGDVVAQRVNPVPGKPNDVIVDDRDVVMEVTA